MRVSTRLLAKAELGRKNRENVDMETYMEICLLRESSSSGKLDDSMMFISGSREDKICTSEAFLNCTPKHSMKSCSIRTSLDDCRNGAFCTSSRSKSDLALCFEYKDGGENAFKLFNTPNR